MKSSTHVPAGSSTSALRPPGGLLVWIFITLELLTFGMAFVAFLFMRSSAVEVFNQSQALLDRRLALLNTVVLLTSGFFVAQAVSDHAASRLRAAEFKLWLATSLGFAFIGIKGFEYRDKIAHGLTMDANDFFAFYWGLTGFHLLHVAIGAAFLLLSALHIRRRKAFADEDAGLETAAMFWHMCDLIWVVLFPLVYFLH